MQLLDSQKLCDELPNIIKNISQEFDGKWRIRKRKIDTHFLVLFIFKLILSKNKQGYSSILQEMWLDLSNDESIMLPQHKPFAASSICEARQKLNPNVFNGPCGGSAVIFR